MKLLCKHSALLLKPETSTFHYKIHSHHHDDDANPSGERHGLVKDEVGGEQADDVTDGEQRVCQTELVMFEHVHPHQHSHEGANA